MVALLHLAMAVGDRAEGQDGMDDRRDLARFQQRPDLLNQTVADRLLFRRRART
ncbi:hypothetical protein D3C72_2593650 [compost metagenome]